LNTRRAERRPPRDAGHLDAGGLPAPVGIDAGGDQAVRVHRTAALTAVRCQRIQPHELVRPGPPAAGFRKLAGSSSSLAAIALTCDLDCPVTARDAASFSTRRVETPGRYDVGSQFPATQGEQGQEAIHQTAAPSLPAARNAPGAA
jgi:hypothetical protein